MFFKTSLEIKEALFYPAPSIFVAYMIEKLLLFLYPPLPRTGLLFKTHSSKINFSIISYKTACYEELINLLFSLKFHPYLMTKKYSNFNHLSVSLNPIFYKWTSEAP